MSDNRDVLAEISKSYREGAAADDSGVVQADPPPKRKATTRAKKAETETKETVKEPSGE